MSTEDGKNTPRKLLVMLPDGTLLTRITSPRPEYSTIKPWMQRKDSVYATTLLPICALLKTLFRREQSRTLALLMPSLVERFRSLLTRSMGRKRPHHLSRQASELEL